MEHCSNHKNSKKKKLAIENNSDEWELILGMVGDIGGGEKVSQMLENLAGRNWEFCEAAWGFCLRPTLSKSRDMDEEKLPSFNGRLNQFRHQKQTATKLPEAQRTLGIIATKTIQPTLITKQPTIKKPNSTTPSNYAHPDKYIHLDNLPPLLKPSLSCLFIGYNPGLVSALKGHYYAHPTNLFWSLIYESRVVDRPVTYKDDEALLDEYNYGFHDLVLRPTKGINELSNQEMIDNVPRLEEELVEYSPKVVCFVGKGIWEKIYRYKVGKRLSTKEFTWGLQSNEEFVLADGKCKLFVLPSTSGLAAGMKRSEKLDIWFKLAELLDSER